MFQPQPTPYSASSFSSFSYGLGASPGLDFLFPTGGAGAGPGGSAALYPPYSSPSPQSAIQQQQHHQHHFAQRRRLNRSGSPIIKMEEQDPGLHDMAAQQAAAERFQPGLEVRFCRFCAASLKRVLEATLFFLLLVTMGSSVLTFSGVSIGTLCRRKDPERCHHPGIRKGRSCLCRENHCSSSPPLFSSPTDRIMSWTKRQTRGGNMYHRSLWC